jgi:hypothetical protein
VLAGSLGGVGFQDPGSRLLPNVLAGWTSPSTFGFHAAPGESASTSLSAATSATADAETEDEGGPESSDARSVDLFFGRLGDGRMGDGVSGILGDADDTAQDR